MDTPSPPSSAIPEDELHALVDGRLAPEAAAALRRRLAADPEATATVAAWQAQREALQALYGPIAESPLPASLLAAAERAQKLQTQAAQWWRWGGMAAAVLLAFGMGWFSGGRWELGHGGVAAKGAGQARHFAQQAMVAHAVFQPEVRHPVEVTAAQQEHLVQWLSKRLNRPLKVPVLTAQGYELVGGRLLPGDEGPRAQFMYQNATGQRITLYLGALKPGSADANATAFSFVESGSVPGFYWVDHGFGYAIAGQLPRTALHELASAVYAQL
jgi:anti-sigma factor RsiW